MISVLIDDCYVDDFVTNLLRFKFRRINETLLNVRDLSKIITL